MSHFTSARSRFTAAAICALATVPLVIASGASAQAAPRTVHAPASFVVHAFPAVGQESAPDDITRLGAAIYVTFQNGVGPLGEPAPSGATASTIQQYSLSGKPGKSWSVPGKVDGIVADPAHRRILMTSNEDGNSSFSVLNPKRSKLRTFAYTGINHGGGTDAVSVYHGDIFVSASNPTRTSGAAVYEVDLDGGRADLTPVFADDAAAVSANTATLGQPVALALTDPDSNTVVPSATPRFGGTFMLDSQGDQQLIFGRRAGSARETLQVLAVSQPLDDTAFATRSAKVLWLTDPSHKTVDMITGPFTSGEAVATVTPDSGPNYLATVDLNTGTVAPIAGLESVTPKGLLFTSAHHQH